MSYNQTMTDVAYNCLSEQKKGDRICEAMDGSAPIMEIPEEKLKRKKSQFYSELMLDNRFASLPENKWDLRNRRKFRGSSCEHKRD